MSNAETTFTLIDTDYTVEDEEVKIRLFGKNQRGETIIAIDNKFKPYLYAIPQENVEDLEEDIKNNEFEDNGEKLEIENITTLEKKIGQENKQKVVKVETNIPANVPKLKNGIWELETTKECREFDIPFYRRYLMDKDIKTGKKYLLKGKNDKSSNFDRKIILEDIEETEETTRYKELNKLAFDIEVYQEEIIMISFYSQNYQKLITTADIDKTYSETLETEKKLLKRFKQIINEKDPDIITGYNTDEYDFKQLRQRFEKYNIRMEIGRNGERMKFNRRGRFSGARIKARAHLDLYPFISHVLSPGLESEKLDLDSVSEELLDKKKEDMTWKEMKQSWKNQENLEEFAEYALKDSKLVYELGEEIIPQILELSKITGLIPFDACRLTYGQLTENYLLKEAQRKNMVAENRPGQDERRKRQRQTAYKGGFVYEPQPGLYENIVTLDFRSLYPTVMVAHNISPDTLNLEECNNRYELEEFDYDFCQDKQGFFPELIENLVKDRYKIKEKMGDYSEGSSEYRSLNSEQKAKKILANSFYGYLGYEGARWYSRESAEATTYLGREYIEKTIEKAEEKGYEVVYGDTDSVFLKKQDIKENINEFLKTINDDLPEFMELEYEGFFKRGFFTSTDSGQGAKKKYALIDEQNEMKITGFEQVRRDWSPIAKETQKKVLQKVLENDIDEAAEVAKEVIQKIKDGEIPVEKLKIYTTLTKEPEEYDSTAPHVEAVKKAKERGDIIEPETTVEYVITRRGRGISDKAELVKYAEDYDSEYYIENQIIPVVLRVLKVFGYTEGQIKGKGKQSGLGKFS